MDPRIQPSPLINSQTPAPYSEQDLAEARRQLRRLVKHNDILGLRNKIGGLDFFACRNALLVIQEVEQLSVDDAGDGLRILDIASWRSPVPSYLAACGHRVETADLVEGFEIQEGYRRRLGFPEARLQNHLVQQMDPEMIRYPFPDGRFDVVTIMNAITVFSGAGDKVVMGEMERLLKPGGVGILSIPYGEYSEGEKAGWFNRCYDETALQERLVDPTSLGLQSRHYFGDENTGRFTSRYWRIPRALRFGLGRIWPRVFLHYLGKDCAGAEDTSGVGIIFHKPAEQEREDVA